MGFKLGIVGLPNVGKSTLFNALTQTAAAQAANYPFCTIEPNVGEVAVPDPRLDKLAAVGKSAQITQVRDSDKPAKGCLPTAASRIIMPIAQKSVLKSITPDRLSGAA